MASGLLPRCQLTPSSAPLCLSQEEGAQGLPVGQAVIVSPSSVRVTHSAILRRGSSFEVQVGKGLPGWSAAPPAAWVPRPTPPKREGSSTILRSLHFCTDTATLETAIGSFGRIGTNPWLSAPRNEEDGDVEEPTLALPIVSGGLSAVSGPWELGLCPRVGGSSDAAGHLLLNLPHPPLAASRAQPATPTPLAASSRLPRLPSTSPSWCPTRFWWGTPASRLTSPTAALGPSRCEAEKARGAEPASGPSCRPRDAEYYPGS